MHFDVITIFPELFDCLRYGVVGRAIEKKMAMLNLVNLREYSDSKRGNVDDRPYGGGAGMLMEASPIISAVQEMKKNHGGSVLNTKVIMFTPQGKKMDQHFVSDIYDNFDHLILISGRYRGIDERVSKIIVDEEISIGDYIISGGELASMILIDAIIRLIPGVLGNEMSENEDSFIDSILDSPNYTRPVSVKGEDVPEVLFTGDHASIAKWRLKQSLGRTWLRRPDLLRQHKLTNDEIMLLNEFVRELE